VLLAKTRILFWAGSDFFASYLEENWSDKVQNIITEELLTKLLFFYEQSQSLIELDQDEDETGLDL